MNRMASAKIQPRYGIKVSNMAHPVHPKSRQRGAPTAQDASTAGMVSKPAITIIVHSPLLVRPKAMPHHAKCKGPCQAVEQIGLSITAARKAEDVLENRF